MITFKALILIHNVTSLILNRSSIYKMFHSFFLIKKVVNKSRSDTQILGQQQQLHFTALISREHFLLK